MTTTGIVAERELVRDMPNGSRVVAELKVYRIGNNAHPHFSATGAVYEQHGTWSGRVRHEHGRESDISGMVHAEILREFPRAAPFVAMHLSAWPSGRPMHALENGWYFYSDAFLGYERRHYGDDYVRRGSERAARTLRCKVEDLPVDADREAFAAFVDAQADRWAREAGEAVDLLATL